MALIVPPDVVRQLAAVPKKDRQRLFEALEMVAASPGRRFSFMTQMVGQSNVWRLRKGDWRAVFRTHESDVILDRVGHRKDVYR